MFAFRGQREPVACDGIVLPGFAMRMKFCLSPLIGLLLCVAATFVATSATAEIGSADRKEIRGVVQRQLEAFQSDDEVTAFSYAAPSVRAQFRTPAEFMRMVRNSYRAVYRPRAVKFFEPEVVNGEIIQAVQVVAPDGTVMVALYAMQHQPDKAWRIAGCKLVPANAQAA